MLKKTISFSDSLLQFFNFLKSFRELIVFFFKRRYKVPQEHTYHSSATHPMYPELYKCNSKESTFVEFCVDGIKLYVENNFIDSLGLGRDSNPDPSALKPSECTTTPSTSLFFIVLSASFKFLMFLHVLMSLTHYDTSSKKLIATEPLSLLHSEVLTIATSHSLFRLFWTVFNSKFTRFIEGDRQ